MLPAVAFAMLALTGCTSTSPAPTTTLAADPPSGPTTPDPTTAPTTSSSDTATAEPSASPAGCAPDGTTLPADARAVTDGDLDGDGRVDSIFYSAGSSRFGVSTASGAVVPVHDPLAGPGRHTAWATRIAGGAVVMVLADGRGGDLYSLQRSGATCAIRPVLNAQGDQYRFDQEDLRGHGTGVGCRLQDGALQLGGYDARPVGADPNRLKVTFTRVTLAADGTTATNGATSVVAASAPSGSATVRIARDSTCASAPIVGSSGQ
jgi:hypothetical protein